MTYTPPILLQWVSNFGVESRDGVAKVPRRNTAPGPLRLHLHSGTLGARVHDVWNIQYALVGHGHRTDGCTRAGLDREGGNILSVVLGRLAPRPGVGARGLHRELAFGDQRETDCKR